MDRNCKELPELFNGNVAVLVKRDNIKMSTEGPFIHLESRITPLKEGISTLPFIGGISDLSSLFAA